MKERVSERVSEREKESASEQKEVTEIKSVSSTRAPISFALDLYIICP